MGKYWLISWKTLTDKLEVTADKLEYTAISWPSQPISWKSVSHMAVLQFSGSSIIKVIMMVMLMIIPHPDVHQQGLVLVGGLPYVK